MAPTGIAAAALAAAAHAKAQAAAEAAAAKAKAAKAAADAAAQAARDEAARKATRAGSSATPTYTPAAPPPSTPPQGEPKNEPPFTTPVPSAPADTSAADAAAALAARQAQAAALARNYLAEFGIDDAEVTGIVNNAFAKGESVDQVLAAVRGTKWYAATYPGIFQGIASGLIKNELDYRNQLNSVNQLYGQYYGRKVGADEFAQYIKNGQDLGTIQRTLQGAANAEVLGKGNLGSLFSPTDLAAIGAFQAGLPNAQAQYLNDVYGYATKVDPLYRQYGQTIDRTSLEGLYNSGRTSQQVGQHLAGQSFVAANQNDLQYQQGAFSEGQLSADQLSAYGDQQAGLGSPLGDKIALRVQQAQQRLQRVFTGALATPALTASGGTLRGGNPKPSDLGA